MTLATRGVIALLLVVIASASAAGQGQRTAITGYPPYTLGAARTSAMISGMTSGSRQTYSSKVPTVAYSKRIQAPIGGFSYSAIQTVEFWNDKVAAVHIYWPSAGFSSVSDWRYRTQDLRQQLLSAYAASLVQTDYISEDGGLLELADSDGNRLVVIADNDDFDLWIVYAWAPYVQKVKEAPAPKGDY